MFGFGPDPTRKLAEINIRVNGARTALSKDTPQELTTDPDGVYDCDNYAFDKMMSHDWPQGVAVQKYDVNLPDGTLHRVLVANTGGKDWVMDNLTNALMTRQDRENDGWRFTPSAVLHMAKNNLRP